jgi:hypothetical protein
VPTSARIRAFGAVLCTVSAATFAGEAGGGGTTVIGERSPWRYYLVAKTDEVKRAPGEVRGARLAYHGGTQEAEPRSSPPPPAGWTGVDFDDSRWPLRRCPVHTNPNRTASLLCARSRFVVEDPTGVGQLTLSLEFRGGVVAYLNGRELTRAHMPEGEVDPGTSAEGYPREAWLDPDGHVLRNAFGDPGKYPERFRKRDRALSGFTVSPETLRKGVNVLALELHRPLTDPAFYDAKTRQHNKAMYCHWSTLGLMSAKLSAAGRGGLAPGTATGGELRVWNQEPAQDTSVADGWPAGEMLRPVKIRGARNGAFSGEVVIGSAGPIRGLKVEVTALQGPDGSAVPASAVRVRYALPDGPPARRGRGWGTSFDGLPRDKGGPVTFDGLEEHPPTEVTPREEGTAAVQPVWVTVSVPADTRPGDYRGKLTASAGGARSVEVPVELAVAGWSLPETTGSASWYWLVQSPESLALAYDVEMWSERHWELIGRSFELMRQVGTRIVYVPMFRQSHLGNEHTMIRWVRQKEGSYTHDFSIFEKYIDLALARLGRIEVVCLHCWPRTSGGSYFGRDQSKDAKGALFTVLDPASGELEEAEGPMWGQPASREFWKPVLRGVRERLARRGLAEAAMVGIAHDVVPSKACVEDLEAALPGAKWVVHRHPRDSWKVHDRPTGYLVNVWGLHPPPWPADKREYGWKDPRLWATFPRYGSATIGTLNFASPLAQYRGSLEAALCAGLKGFGWVGADFWPIKKDKRGRGHHLLDSYTHDRRANLGIPASVTYVLRPGKDGPIASARLEMARQSLQEAEARAFIEKAITDETARARLGPELAGRCQELLDERLRAIDWSIESDWDCLLCADGGGLTGRLYAAAAEVAEKLGAK